MTPRVHTITVVLEHDTRVDDVQALLDAIRCLRGVASVDTVVADLPSHFAEVRVRQAVAARLRQLSADVLAERCPPESPR